MSDHRRVVAVVVTWNRRDLLLEALAAVRDQIRPPDAVVVVDNASTDDTAPLVTAHFPTADLLRLPRNLGGAGGFAAGIERAMARHEPDLVWLLDDDTVPQPMALAALLTASERYPGQRPTVLASSVCWTDGRPHPMNTPRRKPGARRAEVHRAAQVDAVPIRSASFVSIAVEADAVRERGLPVADYFLWNDDFEFTTRLLRDRVGLLCRDSVVVHKTRTFGSTDVDPGERFFYEVRNKVWMFTRSPGLNGLERLVYAGSTLRRWARTFAASGDRTTLACALRRGLVAGGRKGPRDTHDLLAAVLREAAPGAEGTGDG